MERSYYGKGKEKKKKIIYKKENGCRNVNWYSLWNKNSLKDIKKEKILWEICENIILKEPKHILEKILKWMKGGQVKMFKIMERYNNCWWESILLLIGNYFIQINLLKQIKYKL